MRYVVRKSIVRIVGRIWMPATVCSMVKTLSSYDVGNIKQSAMWRVYGDDYQNPTNAPVEITRADVEDWLGTNSGDFQEIIDFEASIEDGDNTIDIPFATDDGESAYLDTLSKED